MNQFDLNHHFVEKYINPYNSTKNMLLFGSTLEKIKNKFEKDFKKDSNSKDTVYSFEKLCNYIWKHSKIIIKIIYDIEHHMKVKGKNTLKVYSDNNWNQVSLTDELLKDLRKINEILQENDIFGKHGLGATTPKEIIESSHAHKEFLAEFMEYIDTLIPLAKKCELLITGIIDSYSEFAKAINDLKEIDRELKYI